MFDLESLFAVMILASFAWLAFRSGRSNPVNTGELEKRMDKDIHLIRNELQALEGRFQLSATKTDINKLRAEIADSAADRADKVTEEFGKIRDQVTNVCEKVVGIEKSADRTAAGVDRLERYFLELGIKGK